MSNEYEEQTYEEEMYEEEMYEEETFEDNLIWGQLARLEPVLKDMLDEARATPPDDGTGSWYCGRKSFDREPDERPSIKRRLMGLVGWSSRNSSHELGGSPEAWRVALDKIQEVLPPCRNCPYHLDWPAWCQQDPGS